MAGKFDNETDKIIYEASMNGADEQLDDVDGFGFYALVCNLTRAQIETMADDVSVVLPEFETELHAILNEDLQGFVSVEYFDTEADARAAWSRLEAEYEAWEAEAE